MILKNSPAFLKTTLEVFLPGLLVQDSILFGHPTILTERNQMWRIPNNDLKGFVLELEIAEVHHDIRIYLVVLPEPNVSFRSCPIVYVDGVRMLLVKPELAAATACIQNEFVCQGVYSLEASFCSVAVAS